MNKKSKITILSLIFLISISVIILSSLINSQEKIEDISNNHTKLNLTENKISIDNPVIYLDSPYNITNSGEYIINLENKENLGLAEIIFLTNSSDYLFRDFQLNNPKNITYQSSFTCKDKLPKIEKGFVTCVYPNGSIEFKHSFESNKDNTFFWNDSYIREWEDLILNKKVLTNEFSKEQTNMGIS